MKKSKLSVVILATALLITQVVFAQNAAEKYYNIWYFGGFDAFVAGVPTLSGQPVGLDFNNQPPSVLLDANTAFGSYEGAASIADINGNLAMYTTGTTIFNKAHQVMDNGSDLLGPGAPSLNGIGVNSSSQGAIFVKKPGNNNLYYLFTTPDAATNNMPEGFRYHIIDMNENNGLGKVIVKNQLLLADGTERVTAVKKKDSEAIWIVTHQWGSNNYYAYLLDSTGIDTTPVISNANNRTVVLNNSSTSTGRGIIKISPNGRKIAMTVTSLLSSSVFTAPSLLEVCDFDPETGIVSNPIKIPFGDHTTSSAFHAYGVEFSPDNTKLYVVDRDSRTNGTPALYQYDFCAGTGDSTSFVNSRVLVASQGITRETGSIQLAPNGKIYIAQQDSTKLDVINNPNEKHNPPFSSCNYQIGGQDLAGRRSSLSLPNFVVTFFNEIPPTDFTVQKPCLGDTTEFYPTDPVCVALSQYFWNFGDPSSGAANTSTEMTPKHYYAQAGTYSVTMVFKDGNVTDTVTKVVNILPPPQGPIFGDSLVCNNQTLNYNMTELFGLSYKWRLKNNKGLILDSTNRQTPINWFINTFGKEKDTLIGMQLNDVGCPQDTFYLPIRISRHRIAKPIGRDTVCKAESASVTYTAPDLQPGTTYTWSVQGGEIINGEGTPQINVRWTDNEGSIRIVAQRDNNYPIDTCLEPSSILNVAVVPQPSKPNLQGDTTFCSGGKVAYYIPTPNLGSTYKWTAENNVGTITTNLRTDTAFVQWNDKASFYRINVTEKNSYGCESEMTTLQFDNKCRVIPNIITPNSDSDNQLFFIRNISYLGTVSVKIYNRWGKLVYNNDNYDNSWNGDELPSGTYFVHLTANNNFTYKGWLQIIR